MEYNVEFYQKENGDIPVQLFLLSLPPKLRAKTFREIELLKNHGPELREPHTKPIKGKNNKGLFELSSPVIFLEYYILYMMGICL